MHHLDSVNVVGIGIGPFNLSTAALLHPLKDCLSVFVDKKPEFNWHPGLLFPESVLQVSFLKDLVSLVDPRSPFSFVSFLVATKRAYRFISADYPRVSRREFNQYLRWVCSQLPNLTFSTPVRSVRFEQDAFFVECDAYMYIAKNVILATGLAPTIPSFAAPHIGRDVFHASEYLNIDKGALYNRRVIVIGGGQTGAEIVSDLISGKRGYPKALTWITRRENFLPLDESPFTNELFTPSYCEYFYSLSSSEREHLLSRQSLASNGISSSTLRSLYQRLYELEYVEGVGRIVRLLPGREVFGLSRSSACLNVVSRSASSSATPVIDAHTADLVVLCTGWHYEVPSFLESLRCRLNLSTRGFSVRSDFSLEWDGPKTSKIFVQNAAQHTHGVAEPNLSLMAWRSARIINSLAGRQVYETDDVEPMLDWHAPSITTGSMAAHI